MSRKIILKLIQEFFSRQFLKAPLEELLQDVLVSISRATPGEVLGGILRLIPGRISWNISGVIPEEIFMRCLERINGKISRKINFMESTREDEATMEKGLMNSWLNLC